jgi:hypothetical protein
LPIAASWDPRTRGLCAWGCIVIVRPAFEIACLAVRCTHSAGLNEIKALMVCGIELVPSADHGLICASQRACPQARVKNTPR